MPPPPESGPRRNDSPVPQRSVSPWARPGTQPIPRHAPVPSEARVLPEPRIIQHEPLPVAAERGEPHHWSDPPPRSQSAPAQPDPAPATATPYFTIPSPAQPVAAVLPAQPLAPRASERPTAKTPPRGVEAGRTSDPGRRSDPGHHDLGDHEHFFASQPPKALSETMWDEHDSLPGTMTHGSKRAMHTTFWILGISVGVIGAFVIYNQVVMPAPAQLTGGTALDLPTPMAPLAEAPQPQRPPTAAPPVAPKVVAPVPVASTPAEAAPSNDPAVEPEPPENEPDLEPELEPENDPPALAGPAEGSPAMGSYRELLDQANIFYRQGKRQRALEAFELAIAVNPNGDEALSKLAYHYLNLGKNEDARQYAQRSVAANPKNSEGWIVLGAAREALRDREGAKEAYRQCATIAEGSFVSECKRLAR